MTSLSNTNDMNIDKSCANMAQQWVDDHEQVYDHTLAASRTPVNHDTPAHHYSPTYHDPPSVRETQAYYHQTTAFDQAGAVYHEAQVHHEAQIHHENQVLDNAAFERTSPSCVRHDYVSFSYVHLTNDPSGWNNISFPGQYATYHGPAMNDVSSMFKSSPALECLRASNPARDFHGVEPAQGRTAPWGTIGSLWDSPATQVLRSSYSAPSQQIVFSTVVGRHDGNKLSNFKAKPEKLRATCEGCRKLKVKCTPSGDGSVCKKCQQKGISCVRHPRAGYGTRVKKSSS